MIKMTIFAIIELFSSMCGTMFICQFLFVILACFSIVYCLLVWQLSALLDWGETIIPYLRIPSDSYDTMITAMTSFILRQAAQNMEVKRVMAEQGTLALIIGCDEENKEILYNR